MAIKIKVNENATVLAHYLGKVGMCNVVIMDTRSERIFHKRLTFDDYVSLMEFIELAEKEDDIVRLAFDKYGDKNDSQP